MSAFGWTSDFLKTGIHILWIFRLLKNSISTVVKQYNKQHLQPKILKKIMEYQLPNKESIPSH